MTKKPVESFYVALGRRLHDARQHVGLTQDQVGQRLTPRMTRAAIANMELGKQRVLTHVLAQLADVLKMTPGEFFPISLPLVETPAIQKVRAELEEKLQLPTEQIRLLTNQINSELGGQR